MREFAYKNPVVTEIFVFVAAMILALACSLAGRIMYFSDDVCIAIGRIIAGFLLLIPFRYCLEGNKPFSGVMYALPALAFVAWNFVYNIVGGASFVGISADAILLGLAPAIFEEIIFRGVFIHNLRKSGKNPMTTLLVSAVFFGLVHMTNVVGMSLVNALVQTGYALVVGLVFGAIYLRSNDLLSVICAHALVDMSNYMFVNGPTTTPIPMIVAFVILLALEAAYALWLTSQCETD